MRNQLCVFALLSLSCESLWTDNPENCVRFPTACGPDSFCDRITQSCQSLDCTINTTLCPASEYCSPQSRRCTPKDCVIEPTICAEDQRCNADLRSCEALSFVLGQPDASTNQQLAYGMNRPEMVRLIPHPQDASKTRLIVADSLNRRILVWNELPSSNRPADVVFGVPDVHTAVPNGAYSGVNEGSIGNAWGVSSDGTRLVLGDGNLARVLIWNQIPLIGPSRGPIPASRVWGQSSFLNSLPDGGSTDPSAMGIRQSKVFLERSPSFGFYISDSANHRVLVFPTLPGGSSTPPQFVLGQPTFLSALPGTSANTLRSPRDVTSDGTMLWVADAGNQRVLGYPLPIVGNAPAATAVIGQPNLNSLGINSSGLNASSLATPNSLSAHKPTRQLFVADGGNHRVLRYSLATSQTTADLVLGQSGFNNNPPNRSGVPGLDTLFNPAGIDFDGTRLAVGDYGNNRVLLWLSPPTSNGQPADVVLGQPSGTSTGVNSPPSRGPLVLRSPQNVATDGTRLFLCDGGNHRVLIWNRIPQDGQTPPDVVLGQATFSGDAVNQGGPVSASSMASPDGISVENGRLAVGDSGNHRVLLWNQIPTQNNQPADLCIGQASCTVAISGPPSSGSLASPTGVTLSGGSLYVADTGNNRVLVFSTPTTQGAVASRVLGQPNMSSGSVNTGSQSASTLATPVAVRLFRDRLFVADSANHRVLLWQTPPTRDGQPANVVIGQVDFALSYPRPDRTLLEFPSDVAVHGERLYISSQTQARILYWAQVPTQSGQPADLVLGQQDFSNTAANNPAMPPIERLTQPAGLLAHGNRLFITDAAHHRLVVRGLVN
jgi:hypothetical protein